MSISLSPDQQRFVDELIRSGQYQSTAEVIQEALDNLRRQHETHSGQQDDQDDLAELRSEIEHAAREFERGEGIVLDRESFMRELRQRAEKRA